MPRSSTEYYTQASAEYAAEYLSRKGCNAQIIQSSNVPVVSTVIGAEIRCGDPKYGLDNLGEVQIYEVPKGPAIFGGFIGICAQLNGRDYSEKAGSAKPLVRVLGFVPATHGHVKKGYIRGCAYLDALTQNMIPDVGSLSTVEAAQLIKREKVVHRLLRGLTTPDRIIANARPFHTAISDGTYYVTDGIWFMPLLTNAVDKALDHLSDVAKLLLPKNPQIDIVY